MRRSTNGHAYITRKTRAGNSAAGKKGLAISWPNARISQLGNSRNGPSRNPTYQSGCDPPDTVVGSYGPYSQIGLIWARPPSSARTAPMTRKSPTDLNV